MTLPYDQVRQQANRVRGMDLCAVLHACGAAPDRYDRAKWHTQQGVVCVTGMKFMNFSRDVGGGGAIDLLMHLENIGFVQAVQRLMNLSGEQQDIAAMPERTDTRVLSMPVPVPGMIRCVKRYLVNSRFICVDLVDSLVASGALYADHRANAVFCMLDRSRKPVGAEIRGTGPVHWCSMAAGSRKDRGFFSIQADIIHKIILCESAIDAVSCLMLHPDCLAVSCAGARAAPRFLAPLLSRGLPVFCGFDADQVGDDMAKAMIGRFPKVVRLRPSAHDWNDVLRAKS